MNAKSESIAVNAAGAVSACAGGAKGSKVDVDARLKCVESNAIQPEDYASERRDKWLNRLAREFLMLDGLFPFKDFVPKNDCPQWFGRVEEEYFSALCRGADLKGAKKFTPTGLGGFFGYQCAYAVWMVESLDAKIESESRNAEKYKDVALTEEQFQEAVKIFQRFNDWYGALRRLAGRALKSCVYQPYEDMSEFMAAYSRAFSRKPKLGAGMGDFGSSNFGIYHFMLWHWRAVDQLDSVRALHDLLRRSMGEYRVGDLRRIEKICQRIGLHYRKPGRPKASK
ncbi:MAG: hypothetical protein ABSG78_16520 [Verrucomicrobiota bacterium]|jgi:hypothetical protein